MTRSDFLWYFLPSWHLQVRQRTIIRVGGTAGLRTDTLTRYSGARITNNAWKSADLLGKTKDLREGGRWYPDGWWHWLSLAQTMLMILLHLSTAQLLTIDPFNLLHKLPLGSNQYFSLYYDDIVNNNIFISSFILHIFHVIEAVSYTKEKVIKSEMFLHIN